MKFLFDLFPVILFFVAFKLYDIFIATAVVVAATILQIGWLKLRHQQVEKMMWINLMIVVVFGGATLISQDETFIKWKPTVFYWLLASALLLSVLLFKKNLIQAVLEKQIQLPGGMWHKLNLIWVGFFSSMGFVNLYVAYRFSLDTWVNFKLFGATGLMLVFIVLQIIWLNKQVKQLSQVVVISDAEDSLERNEQKINRE